MGGRGSKSYNVVRRLPNFKNAKIPKNKAKEYFLNPNKSDKAAFFRGLGYNMKNANWLFSDIKAKLATNKALDYGVDERGNRVFQVNMSLGINHKEVVTTGWLIDKGKSTPRLITAYKNKTKYYTKKEE